MRPRPIYQRGHVTLYFGDALRILPYLEEQGITISDYPYSQHTHTRSRAGARRTPLVDGAGRLSGAAISRKRDLGFPSLKARDRWDFARHAARLSARWNLSFCDDLSAHLWRHASEAAGLKFARTAYWRKIGATPQMTGTCPAVAVEHIVCCHPPGERHWNGHGRHGWYEQAYVSADFDAFERHGGDIVYAVPIALERGGSEQEEAREHTTQKPVALMIALVEDFSDPGELVYDFTSGFNTTGIACMRATSQGLPAPRRYVGIERDRRYVDASIRRFEAEFDGLKYRSAERLERLEKHHGIAVPRNKPMKQVGLFGGK